MCARFTLVLVLGLVGCPALEEEVDASLPDAPADDAASAESDAWVVSTDVFVRPGVDAFAPAMPDAFTRTEDAFAPTDAFTPSDAFIGPDSPAPACACRTGAVCEEASASHCAALLAGCTGTRPTSCPRSGVLYTCVGRLGGATYYSSYDFDDYAAEARACEMDGGTLETTPPPEPSVTDEPCACRRNTGTCEEVYGVSACSTLSCRAPSTRIAGACPGSGAVDGQCVKIDGERRISYYAPTSSAPAGYTSMSAQAQCRTRAGYYWVPYFWVP